MKIEGNMTVRKIDTFCGLGDDDREYTIYVYQEQIIVESLAAGRTIENGLKSYKLNNGNSLNKLPDGTYQIVSTGVIVTPI